MAKIWEGVMKLVLLRKIGRDEKAPEDAITKTVVPNPNKVMFTFDLRPNSLGLLLLPSQYDKDSASLTARVMRFIHLST